MGQCTSRHGRNNSSNNCGGNKASSREDDLNCSGEFDDAMQAGTSRAGSSSSRGRKYMTSDGNSEETDDDEGEGTFLSVNDVTRRKLKVDLKKSDPAAADMFVIDFGGGELPSVADAAAQKGPDGLASRFRRREAARGSGDVGGGGQRAVSLGRDHARGGRRGRAKKPALPSSPSKRSSSSLSPGKSSVTSSRQPPPPPSHSAAQKRRLMNKNKSGSSPSGRNHRDGDRDRPLSDTRGSPKLPKTHTHSCLEED